MNNTTQKANEAHQAGLDQVAAYIKAGNKLSTDPIVRRKILKETINKKSHAKPGDK